MATNPTIPKGAVAINGAQYGTADLQKANFTQITPVGNTLYGVPIAAPAVKTSATPAAPVAPKTTTTPASPSMITGYNPDGSAVQVPRGVYVPGVSLTPPTKVDAKSIVDTSKTDALAQVKQQNADLATRQANIATEQVQAGDYTTKIQEFAADIQKNLKPGTEEAALRTQLADKQTEIQKFGLNTQRMQQNVADTGNDLLTSQVGKSQAQIAHERSFGAQELSLDEANLIAKVNLSTQDRQNIINGDKTMADFQEKIQSHIDAEKKAVLADAQNLTESQRSLLASTLTSLKGVDPDKLTADQTASLTKLATSAGLEPSLVFAGLRATNAQTTLDNNIAQASAMVPKKVGTNEEGQDVYGYVDPTTKQLVITSGKTINSNNSTGSSSSTGTTVVTAQDGTAIDLGTYATDPAYASSIQGIIDNMGQLKSPQSIDSYIQGQTPNSPINSEMIKKASSKYGVPWETLVAVMQHESGLGTSPVAQKNNNYGGVTYSPNTSVTAASIGTARPANEGGNYSSFKTPQDGVNAVAQVLGKYKLTKEQAAAAATKSTQQVDPTDEFAALKSSLSTKGLTNLNKLNPLQQSNVLSLVNGEVDVKTLMSNRGIAGSTARQKLISDVKSVDPSWSENRYSYRQAFGDPKGKNQQSIGAINTALGHLSELAESFNKLDNATLRKQNSLTNLIKKEKNDPNVTNFDYTLNQLSTEIAAAYKGGVPDKAEVDRNYEVLSKNLSPEAGKEVMTRAATLLASKISTLGNQWKAVMGTYPDAEAILQSFPLQQLKDAGIDTSAIEKVMAAQTNYIIGQTYTFANGTQAKYLGNGKFE